MLSRFLLPWPVVVAASLALGYLFSYLGVPAAWILAGIVAAGTMALATKQELSINEHLFSFSRGVIGILAALPLLAVEPKLLLHFVLPGLVVAAVTVGTGVAGGLMLSKVRPAISAQTGILSMMAGAASMLPTLAKDMGADFRYVALSQYLRLLAVSISLPLVTSFFDHQIVAADKSVEWSWWAVLIAAIGGPLAKRLHIPVPSVLGPMLITVILGQFVNPAPAEVLQILAFLNIGWLCGGSLSVPALRQFVAQLPITVLFIVVLMSACAFMAWPLTAWLDISYFEAYLATSPGALETVLALASEGGAGPAVVALQIIRLLSILGLVAFIGRRA